MYYDFYLEFKDILDAIAEREPESCKQSTKLHIETDLQGFRGHTKGAIAPQLIREKYEERILYYENAGFHILSCDASIKTNTGLSVYDKTKWASSFFQIEDTLQSTTAELMALSEAINISINQDYKMVAIFTDSKTACELLRNAVKKDILVTKIHKQTEQLKKVHIIWTPGHMGVLVNECAHKGAEIARNGGKPIIQPLTQKEGQEKMLFALPSYTLKQHRLSCLRLTELELIAEEMISFKMQFPEMYKEIFLNKHSLGDFSYLDCYFKFHPIINRVEIFSNFAYTHGVIRQVHPLTQDEGHNEIKKVLRLDSKYNLYIKVCAYFGLITRLKRQLLVNLTPD